MNFGPGFQVFSLTVICGIQSETTVKQSIGCMNVKGRRRSDSRWTISKEKERGGNAGRDQGKIEPHPPPASFGWAPHPALCHLPITLS